MRRLFARGSRPAIVIECNATMLARQHATTVDLRETLTQLGYRLFFIDHLRPGTLVEIGPETVQTESASDLLAVVDLPGDLSQRWHIETGFSRETIVARLLDAAASPAPGYRGHSADVLAHGPKWLSEAPGVAPCLAALASDVAAEVRNELTNRRPDAVGHAYAHAPEPPSDGPPPGAVAWAESASLQVPWPGMERLADGGGPPDPPVLADLSFHISSGESVAILSEDPVAAYLLLQALAGRAPHAGRLSICARPVLLFEVGRAFEPGLSVEENVVLLGTHLGCHTDQMAGRLDELVERAGMAQSRRAPLSDQGAQGAARVALTVALECANPQLLLVELPRIEDPAFADWARGRIAQMRQDGMAVVQWVRDQSELLSPAIRTMWLRDRCLWAFGHADSIFEADRLERLGFQPAAGLARDAIHQR
jgi:ABC-type polysaccharide/polyol phosphate transport system ATPase subunit